MGVTNSTYLRLHTKIISVKHLSARAILNTYYYDIITSWRQRQKGLGPLLGGRGYVLTADHLVLPRPPLTTLHLTHDPAIRAHFPSWSSVLHLNSSLPTPPSHPHVKSAGWEIDQYEDYRRSLSPIARSPVPYLMSSWSGKLWWIYLWQSAIHCHTRSVPWALTSKVVSPGFFSMCQ